MRSTLLSVVITAGVLMSGCASLSESQCIAGDWQTVGYSDAAAGKPAAALLSHQNACVKHGVVPDREQYLDGWHAGIGQYCTPENGFAVGERGLTYANVCPHDLEPGFNAGLQNGRQLYLARREITDLQRAIGFKETHLEKLKKQIAGKEAEIISGMSTELQRYRLVDETKELAREQGQLEEEIAGLREEVAVKRDRLEDLQVNLAYNY